MAEPSAEQALAARVRELIDSYNAIERALRAGQPQRAGELQIALRQRLDGEIAHPRWPGLRSAALEIRILDLRSDAELCDGPVASAADGVKTILGVALERGPGGQVRALEPAELAALPEACAAARQRIQLLELRLSLHDDGRPGPNIDYVERHSGPDDLVAAWTSVLQARTSLPIGAPNRLDLSLLEPFSFAENRGGAAAAGLDPDVLSWLRAADRAAAEDLTGEFAVRAAKLMVRLGRATAAVRDNPVHGLDQRLASGEQRLSAVAAAESRNCTPEQGTAAWLAWLEARNPARLPAERTRIEQRKQACSADWLASTGLQFANLAAGEVLEAHVTSGCVIQPVLRYVASAGVLELDGRARAGVTPAVLSALDASLAGSRVVGPYRRCGQGDRVRLLRRGPHGKLAAAVVCGEGALDCSVGWVTQVLSDPDGEPVELRLARQCGAKAGAP